MKVSYTRRVKDRLEWHAKRKEVQYYLYRMFVDPISEEAFIDENEEDLKRSKDDFKKNFDPEGTEFTEDQALTGSFIISLVQNFMANNPESAPSLPDVMNNSIHQTILNSRVLRAEDINDNPFLKNIQFDTQSICSTKHGYDTYKKYELLLYDSLLPYEDGISIPRIAVLDHEHSFPCIIREGTVITNSVVSPYCINTKAKAIEEAEGTVLVLGCEIGYFAYMVSEKPNVSKVVIVDNNPEIIDLFESAILPQFPNKEKVTVVETDPYEYMKDLNDGTYDYCFAQIWENSTNLEEYIKLKNFCRRFRETDIVYWLENDILHSAMNYVIYVIQQTELKSKGKRLVMDEQDQLYCAIFDQILKGVRITNASDIDYYMEDRNILKLLEDSYDNLN